MCCFCVEVVLALDVRISLKAPSAWREGVESGESARALTPQTGGSLDPSSATSDHLTLANASAQDHVGLATFNTTTLDSTKERLTFLGRSYGQGALELVLSEGATVLQLASASPHSHSKVLHVKHLTRPITVPKTSEAGVALALESQT